MATVSLAIACRHCCLTGGGLPLHLTLHADTGVYFTHLYSEDNFMLKWMCLIIIIIIIKNECHSNIIVDILQGCGHSKKLREVSHAAVKSFDRRGVSCKNARTVQFSGGDEKCPVTQTTALLYLGYQSLRRRPGIAVGQVSRLPITDVAPRYSSWWKTGFCHDNNCSPCKTSFIKWVLHSFKLAWPFCCILWYYLLWQDANSALSPI